MSLTIWCNGEFNDAATELLIEGTREHRLVWADQLFSNVLLLGERDPKTKQADVLFGQPSVEDCRENERVRWVEITTAGYTRFDTPEFRENFRQRGAALTSASGVFADPCAHSLLAMMLALGRNLLPSYQAQLTDHTWDYEKRLYDSALLTGQTVLMLGYGAIGHRLTELLSPFGMKIMAVRRQTCSERGVTIIPEEAISSALAEADHVVNILPENASTWNYVNARRLSCCKKVARFYNVGRGNTVDERALIEALETGRLGAAYLDVFEQEPLPAEHPLWVTKNCFVTPHTGGGRRDQDEALVKHFLANLETFTQGDTPLTDLVI